MFKRRSFVLALITAAFAIPSSGAQAACSSLNTEDMSAYSGVVTAAAGCQVSKKLTWLVGCDKTASSVTSASNSITDSADAGADAVTDAGSRNLASVSNSGNMIDAYKGAQDTSNVAATTSLANYVGVIDSRKAKLTGARQVHQNNLAAISNHVEQINAQTSQCTQAQADFDRGKLMMANPSTAPKGTLLMSESQSKKMSIAAKCTELGGGESAGGVDCKTSCSEALSNLQKAKSEQDDMVTALDGALVSSQLKLAAAQACQAADAAVADSNKSMVDAMKQGMANADANPTPADASNMEANACPQGMFWNIYYNQCDGVLGFKPKHMIPDPAPWQELSKKRAQ